MEAARLAPKAASGPAHPVLVAIRRFAGKWGLIVALAALPVYYTIHDLVSGYPAFVNGHATTVHDLSYIGTNLFQGISNGAIWALIAIGYTLVYGIIELINFAHGDVFMIGSLTAAGFWAGIGLTLATGTFGVIFGLAAALLVSMVVCGALNVLIERVGYRPLRNAPKLAPLITAVGFSFILQNVGLLWIGGSPQGIYRPDPRQRRRLLDFRCGDPSPRRARDRRNGAARDPADVVRGPHPDGTGDAGHGPGS